MAQERHKYIDIWVWDQLQIEVIRRVFTTVCFTMTDCSPTTLEQTLTFTLY